MAKIIQEHDLSAQSRWDIATLINRVYPYPLDPTTLFTSLSSASNYSKNSGNAYVGQVISVVEDDKVSIYQIKNTDGDLQEFALEDETDNRLKRIETALGLCLSGISELEDLTTNSKPIDMRYNINKICSNIKNSLASFKSSK